MLVFEQGVMEQVHLERLHCKQRCAGVCRLCMRAILAEANALQEFTHLNNLYNGIYENCYVNTLC